LPTQELKENHQILKYSDFDLDDNSITKIKKTQDRFIKSWFKKDDVVTYLECFNIISDDELFENFGISKTDFLRVFGEKTRFNNLINRLSKCGSFLEFHYYFQRNDIKLKKANFCKKDKMCPACAVRRASKQQDKFFDFLGAEPDLLDNDWYYLVIPVKHTKEESIEVVYERLNRIRKFILKAMRDARNGKKAGFFGNFLGGMGSIEVTKTDNGWNIHMNMLLNAPKSFIFAIRGIKNKKGQVSYQNVKIRDFLINTADSYMHNITKLDFSSDELIKKNLLEVLKYSLKFSSLDTLDLIKVYIAFYRKQLFFTFGNLAKIKLEKVELDEKDKIDEDFIRLIFERYFDGFVPNYKLSNVDIIKSRLDPS
jgi:hypothetical protein